VKEEERVAFYTPVLLIQLLDSLWASQPAAVLRHRFCLGIAEISHQTEVQVLTPICQKPDFKRLDQISMF